MNVDPLVVAIIRAFNGPYLEDSFSTDEDLVRMFGKAAQPLADGIRAAIAEEVQRQVEAAP